MSELAFASATELAAKLAAKEVSARELIEVYLDRIEAYNLALNAIIWMDAEAARAEADASDARRASGDLKGPLDGVPVSVKESFDLTGSPTTWGVPEFKDNIATSDSNVVERYRAAGANVFAKTNVPFMLSDWQSFNEIYGTCNNPWDQSRSPGGSSGGTAAALAAGMTGLDAGSDIGASIRNPAHYNGVFGLKPTWNVVSKKGHTMEGWHGDIDIAVAGPLARTADDLKLAFDTIRGPGPFDRTQWALNLPVSQRRQNCHPNTSPTESSRVVRRTTMSSR